MPDSSRDIRLTLGDLKTCGAEVVLKSVTELGYMARHSALTDAAEDLDSTLAGGHRNALRFLAGICSMTLSSAKIGDPFGAMWVLHDRRSMVPGDLSPEELTLLEQYLPLTEDSWLKGRIAHLLWLRHTPRDIQHALEAIDSYRNTPLTVDAWIRDGDSAWTQALILARLLGEATYSRLLDMQSALVDAVISKSIVASDVTLFIEPVLREHKVGLERANDIAINLIKLGDSFTSDGNFLDAGRCYQRSQWWFTTAEMLTDAYGAAIQEAGAYIAEAERRASSDRPSHMVAAHWYEEALRALRTIPQAARVELKVDQRIQAVRSQHDDAVGKATHEVSEIRTPDIDITNAVLSLRSAATGKPTNEAVLFFLNMIRPPDIEDYRKSAEEVVVNPSIRHLVSGVFQSADGRTVGLRPSASPQDPDADREKFILSEMLFEYQFFVGFCSVLIQAVLDAMHAEHRLSEQDFVTLSELSPVVPRGRAMQVGKALHLGYERDFATAIHILVPQIENVVRELLTARDLETSTIRDTGIHHYKSLESLLALPGAEAVLGPTLLFELQALLCDPFREGLRNEVAHGLLADDQIVSQSSIYVWWVFFRLVFNPVWQSRQDPTQAEGEGGGDSLSPEQ